jgi:hypothetical protein
MKLDRIPMVILILMWAVVVAVMLLPEADDAYGVVHPEFSTMKHGGSGVDRHAQVLWHGWAFGALVMLTAVSLMAFGVGRNGRARGLGPRLGVAATVYLAIFTCLVVAYSGYMNETTHRLYLGFPAPTAIMLFLFLPFSTVFNSLFVIGFKRWVLSDEDAAEYQRLVSDRRRRQQAADDARRTGAEAD